MGASIALSMGQARLRVHRQPRCPPATYRPCSKGLSAGRKVERRRFRFVFIGLHCHDVGEERRRQIRGGTIASRCLLEDDTRQCQRRFQVSDRPRLACFDAVPVLLIGELQQRVIAPLRSILENDADEVVEGRSPDDTTGIC